MHRVAGRRGRGQLLQIGLNGLGTGNVHENGVQIGVLWKSTPIRALRTTANTVSPRAIARSTSACPMRGAPVINMVAKVIGELMPAGRGREEVRSSAQIQTMSNAMLSKRHRRIYHQSGTSAFNAIYMESGSHVPCRHRNSERTSSNCATPLRCGSATSISVALVSMLVALSTLHVAARPLQNISVDSHSKPEPVFNR